MTTVQTLLAITAVRNRSLWQMDVKNAFLHGDLQDTVSMKLPPRYACPPHHICRLRKSLYGLKEAPRAWFDKFKEAILRVEFY